MRAAGLNQVLPELTGLMAVLARLTIPTQW
jgi:hypothetical protein